MSLVWVPRSFSLTPERWQSVTSWRIRPPRQDDCVSVTIRQELHVVSVLMMITSDQVHDSEVQRHQFTDEL